MEPIRQTTAQISNGLLEIPSGEYRVVVDTDTDDVYLAKGTGTGSTYGRLIEQPPPQTITMEGGYFTKGALPKLGYLDRKSDTYRDLYGQLIHPIRTNDREFLPNVVVTDLVDNGNQTDTLTYVQLTAAIKVVSIDHGFPVDAQLFIGRDGELTTDDPNDFRTIRCGIVLTASTLLIHAPEATEKQVKDLYTFEGVKVWERIQHTSVDSVTINNGSAQVFRSDLQHDATPDSATLVTTLFADNQDDVRFTSDNTGLTFELDKQCYVSDMQMQLARMLGWMEEGQASQRVTFDVHVFTLATDGSPAETIKVWDRADGPISRAQGLNHTIQINQICEKIQLEWATSTSTLGAQGFIQKLSLWGKPRLDKITLGPGGLPVKYERWEIPKQQKLILCSGRVDVDTVDRTGITLNATSLAHEHCFGTYSDWTPTPGTIIDYTLLDDRALRDFVHASINGKTWNRTGQKVLVYDLENVNWIYDPADDQATRDLKDARWDHAYAHINAIAPEMLKCPYTHPYRNSVATRGYFYFGQSNGQTNYTNAIIREQYANKVYELSDFMAPTVYANDLGNHDEMHWRYVVDMAVQESHKRGKLCIPHFSGWDYVDNNAVPGVQSFIEWVLERCDGIMFWDSSTSAPWTEPDRQSYATATRNAIDLKQSKVQHYDETTSTTTLNVSGLDTITTSGNGDAINKIKGDPGQIITIELSNTDSIVAGTGSSSIDFGSAAGAPVSPWSPIGGGTMILRHKADDTWLRLLHQ